MRFEIAVYAEPSFLDLLSQRLNAALPSQCLSSLSLLPISDKMPGLFLRAGDPKTMDAALIFVYRELEALEKSLAMKAGETRVAVRNLEYGEPTPVLSSSSPFKPVSSLTICPWNGSPPEDHRPESILLDSLSAFGSGTHPTTILCLEFIERMFLKTNAGYAREGSLMPFKSNRSRAAPGLSGERSGADGNLKPGLTVLDFGCGTAILAIAAVKLGAPKADGVEIDHDAAQTACRNVRLNRLEQDITIMEGSLEALRKSYGIILANLVAAAHLRVGMGLSEHLNPDGYILISGFGAPQASQIEQIYTGRGLEILERREKDGWSAVLLCKS